MSDAPAVAIVVLNWNGREDTMACLDSLAQVRYPNVHVIVVDNGSSDGSEEAVRDAFPHIPVLQTRTNLGYAEGNNVGIRYCLAHFADDYLLLLNNDTVVDPDFLAELVAVAESRPDAGIFGPKIYYQSAPDTIWFAGGQWDAESGRFVHIGQGERDCEAYGQSIEVDYITGCALMVRRRILETVGLLDRRFFLTFEESDLCLRARRAGKACVLVPQAKIWHVVSSSFGAQKTPLSEYFFARNRLLFGEMHLDLRQRLRLYASMLLEFVFPPLLWEPNRAVPALKRAYWILNKERQSAFGHYRDRYYLAYFAGVRDYLLRRFGDCPASSRRKFSAS